MRRCRKEGQWAARAKRRKGGMKFGDWPACNRLSRCQPRTSIDLQPSWLAGPFGLKNGAKAPTRSSPITSSSLRAGERDADCLCDYALAKLRETDGRSSQFQSSSEARAAALSHVLGFSFDKRCRRYRARRAPDFEPGSRT